MNQRYLKFVGAIADRDHPSQGDFFLNRTLIAVRRPFDKLRVVSKVEPRLLHLDSYRLILAVLLMAFAPVLSFSAETPASEFRDATIYISEGNDPEVSPEQRTFLDLVSDNLPKDQAFTGHKVAIAARELADYVKRMTGVELKVAMVKDVSAIPKDSRSFVLGPLATSLGLKVPETEYRIDGFAYDVDGKRVRLAGETPLGVMYAVYDFLERQGIRWFLPGSEGEHVPKRETLDLPDSVVSEKPAFLGRTIAGGPRTPPKESLEFIYWAIRNKAMGGLVTGCGHMWDASWESFGGRDKAFKERPDLFGEVDGKRTPAQWNLSSPELAHIFADWYRRVPLKGRPKDFHGLLSFSPEDGLIIDTSSESRKLILQNDPVMMTVPDSSELIARLANWVIEDLNKDYPNVRLGYIVYANSQMGPRQVKLNPNLIPIFAPLALDRYHWVGDPRSPTQYMLSQSIERISEAGARFGWYAYSFGGGDCLMPISRLDMLSHNLTWLYSKGLRYWYIESAFVWPNMMPDYYIMTKLLWNAQADQKKLLDEYYTIYFGKAAEPMREYTRELNTIYQDLPFCGGNREFMGSVFTKERLHHLRGVIEKAARAVRDDPPRAHHVKMYDYVLRMGEMHMAIREALNHFKFDKAQQINEELNKLFTEVNTFDPNTSSLDVRERWHKAMYAGNVARIAEWTKGAKILHRFPDEWPAFLDWSEIGEGLGALKEETPLFKLMKLKTWSACLAEQGWERMRGALWYREKFPTVRAPEGKKLYLLVCGFDDTLTAWVNGHEIGKGSNGNLGPGIYELPELPSDRKEHTLTIRVTNKGISELGTGGIIRPVCIIARDPLPAVEKK